MRVPDIAKRLKGIWIDIGAGSGHYLKFMSERSYGLDINEIPEKKFIVGTSMMLQGQRI